MRNLIRVLVIGFAAVIALLAAAAAGSVYNARSIKQSTDTLVVDQLTIVQLLDQVEREQNVLNAALYRLSTGSGAGARQDAVADLDQTDDEIKKMAAAAHGGEDEADWNTLERAVLDFSQLARQLLSGGDVPDYSSEMLFVRHEKVREAVARLVELSYARAVETRVSLDRQADRLASGIRLLLVGCMAVALVCAIVTVRIAARVFRQMEFQAGELSRVSFRMLETQESTARRFAHELHDELGGALTAMRSNLTAVAARLGTDGEARTRVDDCVKMVDESISNVRELSQLLRPTILDDFGLDAGIHWLVTRFHERTGIEVEYKSEFEGRLADETETHLFRIVQEALTNIARHSGATRAWVRLRAEGGKVRLTVRDNGKGLGPARPGSMGLSGMRARARSAGGELSISSEPGAGVTIEVTAAATEPRANPTAGELV